MGRLGSTFVTLWVTIFVPSLIIWGLMVRWSDSGARRFESVWRWLADLLAFPIIFSPLTDWSWQILDTGTALGASLGFVSLVAVWTLMLSAPLIFVGGWWVLITQRLASNSTASSGFIEYGGSSSLQSPSRALYLITFPLALGWTGMKKLASPFRGFGSSYFLGAFAAFLITFALVGGFLAVMFGTSAYWDRIYVIDRVAQTMWFGYLDTLYIPALFEGRWLEAIGEITQNAGEVDYEDWPAYMGSWYKHDEFRTVVVLTSARHGLGTAFVFVIWRFFHRKH